MNGKSAYKFEQNVLLEVKADQYAIQIPESMSNGLRTILDWE